MHSSDLIWILISELTYFMGSFKLCRLISLRTKKAVLQSYQIWNLKVSNFGNTSSCTEASFSASTQFETYKDTSTFWDENRSYILKCWTHTSVMVYYTNVVKQLMICLHKGKLRFIRGVNRVVNKDWKERPLLHKVSYLSYFMAHLHWKKSPQLYLNFMSYYVYVCTVTYVTPLWIFSVRNLISIYILRIRNMLTLSHELVSSN